MDNFSGIAHDEDNNKVGDLKLGMNQVVIAAADGALAATQIWRDIRRAEGTRRSPLITAA